MKLDEASEYLGEPKLNVLMRHLVEAGQLQDPHHVHSQPEGAQPWQFPAGHNSQAGGWPGHHQPVAPEHDVSVQPNWASGPAPPHALQPSVAPTGNWAAPAVPAATGPGSNMNPSANGAGLPSGMSAFGGANPYGNAYMSGANMNPGPNPYMSGGGVSPGHAFAPVSNGGSNGYASAPAPYAVMGGASPIMPPKR